MKKRPRTLGKFAGEPTYLGDVGVLQSAVNCNKISAGAPRLVSSCPCSQFGLLVVIEVFFFFFRAVLTLMAQTDSDVIVHP